MGNPTLNVKLAAIPGMWFWDLDGNKRKRLITWNN